MLQLRQAHEEIKERYEATLLDSRLLMFNTTSHRATTMRRKLSIDASPSKQNIPVVRSNETESEIHKSSLNESDVNQSEEKQNDANQNAKQRSVVICDPLNANRLLDESYSPPTNDDETTTRLDASDRSRSDCGWPITETDSFRGPYSFPFPLRWTPVPPRVPQTRGQGGGKRREEGHLAVLGG